MLVVVWNLGPHGLQQSSAVAGSLLACSVLRLFCCPIPPLELCCPLSSRRLDLAGVKDPLAAERDGISFAPVLRGEQDVLEDPEKHRVAILVEKPVGVLS